MARYAPIHAGEILKVEFLDGLGITQYVLSRDAGIDKGMLSRIVHGKSSISAETALRLATYFGTSADSWMNLQSRYDLEVAKDRAFKQIQRDVRSYDESLPTSASADGIQFRPRIGFEWRPEEE